MLFRLINAVDKRKLVSVFIIFICLLWDIKLNNLVTEYLYTKLYGLFNCIGIAALFLACMLYFKRCNIQCVLMFVLIISSFKLNIWSDPLFVNALTLLMSVFIFASFKKSCLWTKLILSTQLLNAIVNILSLYVYIPNKTYYTVIDWMFITVAVFSIIMACYINFIGCTKGKQPVLKHL